MSAGRIFFKVCYNKCMKKYLTLAVVVAVAGLFPAVSLAASMNAGSSVSVQGTGAAQGNAYAAGGMVTASGVINGDLLAAGGTVVSSAKVNGDILMAGGNITITGVSAQDVRIAGGNVTVGGSMTGELVAVGGNLTVAPGTTIVKDSYMAGGTVNFYGAEAGNLKLSGGDIYFDGTANGNVTITHANKVTVGPDAVIKGTFEYSAPEAAAIDGGATIAGTPVFHEVQNAKQDKNAFVLAALGILTLWWLVKLLIVLTAAYLLWYCFRKDALAILDQSRSHYGMSLLRGFVFIVVVPVGVVISFITVIGAIPGIVALFIYGALLVLAAPLAALFAATLLRKGKTDMRWYHILLGAAVISIVSMVPFIGWIAYALAYLAVLGGIMNVLKAKFVRK